MFFKPYGMFMQNDREVRKRKERNEGITWKLLSYKFHKLGK